MTRTLVAPGISSSPSAVAVTPYGSRVFKLDGYDRATGTCGELVAIDSAAGEQERFGAVSGFALSADGEGVYLYKSVAGGGQQVDAVTFGAQLDNLSVGRLADGAWALNQPTFGAANQAARTGDAATLKINEWNTDGVAPFADDFVELYNPDALPIDLGGYYLSDKPIPDPTKHDVPALTFVPGNTTGTGGYRTFIADDDASAFGAA